MLKVEVICELPLQRLEVKERNYAAGEKSSTFIEYLTKRVSLFNHFA